MSKINASIVMLRTLQETEFAVKELARSGFDMKMLSIVGTDYHTVDHVVGFYNTADKISYWGQQGAFWGNLWNVSLGSAFFIIPGLGPVVVAGPLVSAIVGGLEGTVLIGGLSALGVGLYGIGIPKDSILKYERALESQKFMLVVQGSIEEINQASEILRSMHYLVDRHFCEKGVLV